ncbi:MAG: hypothetical protein ISR97_01910 [Nitrospira sp.]|nr:hypothetical protein [Nitrospira sp.]
MNIKKDNPLIGHDLHHEIFGSILDRSEMTPYLLLRTDGYDSALRQAAKIMGNRGFDVLEDGELGAGEKKRAIGYIEHAYRYCFNFLFPALKGQLQKLETLNSLNLELYRGCLQAIADTEAIMESGAFREVVFEDPRHLFLMASSRKYPHVFHGYKGRNMDINSDQQQTACSILKVAYLIKSIEEDSQDINDYGQLGLFFEMEGQSLNNLYNYNWHRPQDLPESEPAQRAFVKISSFFLKLKDFINFDKNKECLVFNSGDGVEVEIVKIESRLKSPESMFTKLGKDVEGEVHNIRDVLALTFIIKNMDDTLMLFHALQKRGVILQENTISQTITQTLFSQPKDMSKAVRRLIVSLGKSEGEDSIPDDKTIMEYADKFYSALSVNAAKNPHSSMGHNKFQCKLNISIPIHRNTETGRILIPGTEEYMMRNITGKKTGQHTLPLELRISDEQSWRQSEQKGDSHHDAYKFRQLVSVMNRVFQNRFNLTENNFTQLREDQKKLFP